jgi:hypothetical protein
VVAGRHRGADRAEASLGAAQEAGVSLGAYHTNDFSGASIDSRGQSIVRWPSRRPRRGAPRLPRRRARDRSRRPYSF